MLSERISADLKQAMLSRDTAKVSVLRMLQSELKNAGIAKQGELEEWEEISVVRKEIKKRNDAVAMYKQGNNTERAEGEAAEAAVLAEYLPAAADEEAVRAFLKAKAVELGTLEPRHKGDLIRAALQEFGDGLDGQKAAALVGELY